MRTTMTRFLKDRRGTVAVEYTILCGVMMATLLVAFPLFSDAWFAYTMAFIAKISGALGI